MSVKSSPQATARNVLAALQKRYPHPRTHLDAQNAWELLVATVLAAQCTDARVNTVTPELFRRWPTPAALAEAPLEELESGSFGVREPSLAAPQYNMDLDGQALCLVPGLCFDNKGYRLGYGKGYYDRFLARFRGVTLGLCYNDFLQDCLPVGDYDLPVQQIATEDRVFAVEQGAAYE